MKQKLFPNCSEIVWRLHIPKSTKEEIIKVLENKEHTSHTTYMAADFPNNFLGLMINLLKKARKEGANLNDIKLKMVANDNEEDWNFIKEGYKLAKLCLNKKMDREKAQDLLEEFFEKGMY